MNILDKIIATKRIEIADAISITSYDDIFSKAKDVTRSTISFKGALENSKVGIISEFKRKSPSKGFFKEEASVNSIVSGYAKSGAAAISVLTDSDYFGGSLADLVEARKCVNIPLLRKDFIIDPYQICEAKIAGADVILLIASALTKEDTIKLARFAHELNLEVLLEIHNETEIAYINEYVDVVGVNNRNLSTFVTEINYSIELYDKIPSTYLKISESGISDPQTVKALQKIGYKGFLMGENFMKEQEPPIALANFIKSCM